MSRKGRTTPVIRNTYVGFLRMLKIQILCYYRLRVMLGHKLSGDNIQLYTIEVNDIHMRAWCFQMGGEFVERLMRDY